MAKVLKICWGPWENASRDKRELSVYREQGYDVVVMASGNREDRGRADIVESFPVMRYGVEPLGPKVPVKINQVLSLLMWGRYARDFSPDIISGHDFTGWIVGWMANMFHRKKPIFIYDAHEFELGRNAKRGKVRTIIIQNIERFIIHHSAFTIMVNDSIADEVKKVYKLKERPVVVRSTPNYWNIDINVCEEKHKEFLEIFNNASEK